jgi:putative peptidoglycan lipid II flippase
MISEKNCGIAGEDVNRKRLFQVIGVVTVVNVLSRFFGFIREVMIGYHFGTSSLADSVVLAYTIPNFLYLVLGGAITTAYISIYSKMVNDTEKQRFHDTVFTYMMIFLLLLTVGLILFSKPIVEFFFSGLTGSQLMMTSRLFAITAPSTLFLVFSMWFSGILNAQNQFYGAAVATLVNNVMFVLLVMLFYPFFGIYAYGWGAVASAVMMIMMLFVHLRKNNLHRFRFQLVTTESEYIVRMLKIAIPVLFGGATLQLYIFIQRMFSSQLEAGYVAALNYASKFVQLPQVILMTSVTTVIYPMLAKKTAEQDYVGISSMFFYGLKSLFMIIIPVSIFVYFYAEEMVKLIFEYGSFTEQSTKMTAMILKIFVIGMFAQAANLFVTRFFYAMEKSFVPVATGMISVFGVNILIIKLFIGKYGADAVAWGTTISAIFQFLTLIAASMVQLRLRPGKEVQWLRLFMYTICVTIAASMIHKYINFSNHIVNIAIGGVTFSLFSFLLLKLFRLISFRWLPIVK